jgi:hypothetical protein
MLMLRRLWFMAYGVQIPRLPAQASAYPRRDSLVNANVSPAMKGLVLYKLLPRSSKLNGK